MLAQWAQQYTLAVPFPIWPGRRAPVPGYVQQDAREKMKARQPHGRLVSPEEIAAMAAYLASDEADSVVGACMVVDGGITAR